ncbi:MAG: dipeptidase [Chitinophagaceae bacterium]|nr:dipeptidase [Chitinophagaceae bacterium]
MNLTKNEMKLQLLIFLSLLIINSNAQSYQKIHSKAIVVDTHNDILTKIIETGVILDQDLTGKAHSDLIRLKKGGMDLQFFSVWSDGNRINPFAYAMRQMDTLDAIVKRNPDKIVKVATVKEIYKAAKQHKIAAMFGIEGGHQIENDLKKLDTLYYRGARYITLTWNNSTNWATSAAYETSGKILSHIGLNDFGKEVVKHMNKLGMMIDVSHVGDQTFWDVINTTTKPIIASHSSIYNITPQRRNLKDDQIKAIAKNGGVIQINFYPLFIDSTAGKKFDDFLNLHMAENDSLMNVGINDWVAGAILFSRYSKDLQYMRPPLSTLIQHIEYVIKLVGVDYVGLGSDFDGIEFTPLGLDDVSKYPLITKALLEKGYSKKDVTKILGGNLLRVLKANETNY